MSVRRSLIQGACALGMLAVMPPAPALASESAALTVYAENRGAIVLRLSLEELEAFPQHEIVTENEFTNEPVAYSGPLVRHLLENVGFDQLDLVRFTAANDYFVDIPVSDFDRYDAVLAMRADGRRLSRRDKGPLWLMYPISDHPELRDPVYNTRLIWQVVHIEAL